MPTVANTKRFAKTSDDSSAQGVFRLRTNKRDIVQRTVVTKVRLGIVDPFEQQQTIDVRQQVKQMTYKRSRYSFYFWEQKVLFFEAFTC